MGTNPLDVTCKFWTLVNFIIYVKAPYFLLIIAENYQVLKLEIIIWVVLQFTNYKLLSNGNLPIYVLFLISLLLKIPVYKYSLLILCSLMFENMFI